MKTQTSATSKKQTPNGVDKTAAMDTDAPIADKLKESLHSTVDAVAEKAQHAEKAVRSGAVNTSEVLSEKQQQIQKSWEASSVRKYATENPVATAGIVFIAGALFGKFLSRN